MAFTTSDANDAATQVHLSWDPPEREPFLRRLLGAATGHDIDLIVSTHDAQGDLLDLVWHRQETAHENALVFSGDATDGTGEGPDEHATLNLDRLPPECVGVAVTVSTHGHGPPVPFGKIPNATLNVIWSAASEWAHLTEEMPTCTTATPFLIRRFHAGWVVKAIQAEGLSDEDPLDTAVRVVTAHWAKHWPRSS